MYLKKLLKTFGDDTDRLTKIVTVFVTSTPAIVNLIAESIEANRTPETSALVHKIKSRYGYFGLTAWMDELTHWETALKEGKDIGNERLLLRLKTVTNQIICNLQRTAYYIPEGGHSLPLAGKKVLVAEDDTLNAAVFKLFITEKGAAVILAADGNEALQLALKNRPDMIFMDVHMPFFNGLDSIRELRKNAINCPIVSLSASSRLNEKQNSLDAGADDFLSKPASRDSINELLLKYLV